jgi:hypothetical protein
LTWSKLDLPKVENFEIKYDFQDVKRMNNFFHRSFLGFGLKSR